MSGPYNFSRASDKALMLALSLFLFGVGVRALACKSEELKFDPTIGKDFFCVVSVK